MCGGGDVVGPVAVHARGRHPVAPLERLEVHAVERLRVVREVAPLALLVVREREVAQRLERPGLVRHRRHVLVAVGAAQLVAVDRLPERVHVDVQRPRLAARQRDRHALVAVAAQARLHVGRLRRGSLGRREHQGGTQQKRQDHSRSKQAASITGNGMGAGGKPRAGRPEAGGPHRDGRKPGRILHRPHSQQGDCQNLRPPQLIVNTGVSRSCPWPSQTGAGIPARLGPSEPGWRLSRGGAGEPGGRRQAPPRVFSCVSSHSNHGPRPSPAAGGNVEHRRLRHRAPEGVVDGRPSARRGAAAGRSS